MECSLLGSWVGAREGERWAQTEVWVRRKGKWVSGGEAGAVVERMASGGGSVPQSVCPELSPPGSPASGAKKSGSANTQLGKADQLHLIRDLRVVAAGCLHGGERGRRRVSADKKTSEGRDGASA